ncbi:nuclear envelope pore membrane protein POM 121 isoform X2 [Toxorhynchites rutilus septentrionalis]|nr:nuclear envelope pore membrane protein POM 121 isoform X2 [Toxorhynchites rutilus septentrionalis]
MADSTHLESRAGTVGRSISGLLGTSPKQIGTVKRKPTSPLLSSKTNFKSSGSLTTTGLSRIDPQVYTDAQSRGLVNRLVKYHDKSQSTLNRSQSMTNLYTKPGQFPVVHLRKTEIKYSPRRNSSITSVRIAPPEKSVFQANTRSNILRAGSLLVPSENHLKASRAQEDETDSENKVIAPTAEVETAPTRSVLDALKEISRKRINNEELDADRIKKQCKELTEVDTVGVGTKRARELPSSASPPLAGSADQQLQKKRLCSKNNDISSSLSSSLVMNTPKRVEYVQPRPGRLNVDQSFSSQAISPGSCETAVARESRVDSLDTGKVRRTESSPLPQTVKAVAEVQLPAAIRPQPKQPKITLFNKKYDESLVRPATVDDKEDRDDDDELGGRISFIKPKQKSPILNSDQVALKRVEKSKLSLILSCLSDDYNDEEEAPKEVLSVLKKDTVDAPPKVEEKKQELPVPTLSGISALINNPIKDAGLGKIDSPQPSFAGNLKESPKPAGGFTFGTTSAAKPAESTFAFGTSTKTLAAVAKPEDKPSSGFTFGTTPVASAVAASKADAPPAYSFPSTASNQTSSSSVTAVSSVVSAPPSLATPATANLISFSPAPVVKPAAEKSAFSLLPAVTTNETNSSVTTTQSGISFRGGNEFSAFKVVSSAPQALTTTTTGSSSLPSFGNIAASTITTTNPTTGIGFTGFGKDPAPKAAPAANAFTFGGASAAKPSTVTVGQNSSSSAMPTATLIAPVSAASAPTTFGGFGNTSTTPAFGFGAANTTASTAPSFGTATTSAASSFGSKPFGVFGTGGPTTTAAAAPPPPSFGNVSSNPASVFGGGSTVTKPAADSPFAFGGASAAQASANNTMTTQNSSTFSFGAKAVAAGPMTNVFGTSNGNSNNTATFGTMATAAAPTFGAMTKSNPPAFGAPSGSGTNAAPSVFGAQPSGAVSAGSSSGGGFGAASVFGGGSSNAPSASSVFGGSVGSTSSAASPFGTMVSNTATPAGGIFGAAASSSIATNNNNQSAPGASGAFTFGASSASSGPSTTATNAGKPFAFGQANNNSSMPAAAVAATPIKSNSFGFTAGSNTAGPSSNSLGGGGANSSFSFGTHTNANNNNNNSAAAAATAPAFGSNSTFSFSANTNNNTNIAHSSNNQAMVKPFSFGGVTASQPQAGTGGGMFGSGNVPSATIQQQPAFNFSTGSNSSGAFGFNSAMPTPIAAGGPFAVPNGAGGPAAAPMFSIGTGGNNAPPSRRPIRTATRRHK